MVVQEGPENNIASTFAFDLKGRLIFLLYYFQPSWRGIHIHLKAHAPASSSATNMVCLVRRRYLAPCDWFLALLDLFESFYVCYICSYFQTDSFHSGMTYFFYMVLYRFIAGSCSKLQNSSGNGIYLFWAIWLARALRNASFQNLVSAPS